MCRELIATANALGMSTVAVALQPIDTHRPAAVLMEIVPQLQELPGAAGCDPAGRAALTALTDPLGNEETHDPARSATDLQGRLRKAVVDLVDAVADEQAILIVVENLHWCDPLSGGYLRLLVEATGERPLALCVTSRAQWDVHQWDVAAFPMHTVRLEPLSEADAREHARDYAVQLGVQVDDDYPAWAARVSEGNPFYLEELLNHAARTGDRRHVPPSMAALLEARIGRLTADARNALCACAVLGKNSTLDRLDRMDLGDRGSTFRAIDELGRAGMLITEESDDAGGTLRVVCRHDLIRRAVVDSLAPPALALLHRRAATLLEAEPRASDSAAHLWDSADHWWAAGDSEQAIRLALVCIRHLLEAGLASEALDRCELALQYCRTDEQRLQVTRAQIDVLTSLRDWERVYEATMLAQKLRHESEGTSVHDDFELAALYAGWRAGHAWTSILGAAMSCVESDRATPEHRAEASVIAARVAAASASVDVLERAYRVVATLSPALPDDNVHWELLSLIYHSVLGSKSHALDRARAMVARSAVSPPRTPPLSVLLTCATVMFRFGYAGEGENLLVTTFDQCKEAGYTAAAGEIAQLLINRFLDRGDAAAARHWGTQYRSTSTSNPGAWTARVVRLNLARLEIAAGRHDVALELLASGDARLWEGAAPAFRASAIAARIQAAIGAGEPAVRVAPLVDRLDSLLEPLKRLGGVDDEVGALYDGLCHLGRHEVAANLVANYLRDRRETLAPPPGPLSIRE